MIDYPAPENNKDKPWKVAASTTAKNCRNFIREIVENLDLAPNPDKSVIALSIGDPTVYGNLPPSTESIEAVVESVQSGKHNGYAPCAGYDFARKAVADYTRRDEISVEPNDIILCSGCSSSLEMCITVLADGSKNHNILIPRPGFPIYRTLAECIGVQTKLYNLSPERNFEVDLKDLRTQIDENTAAIVVNNPSNPCGSVYNREHLRKILEIAKAHRVPIIADEIYEKVVYSQSEFVSMAALESDVPLLICSGLTKRFLVPGWRMGWVFIHDPLGAFQPEVRKGLNCLSQRTIGSNTIVQGALPAILQKTPQSFYDNLIEVLEQNALLAFRCLRNVKGLTPYMPQGAMYMMIEIQLELFPSFKTVLEFIQRLMEEESVFCLPGEGFFMPGFMRIVLTTPEDILKEACGRMEDFCSRYYLLNNTI